MIASIGLTLVVIGAALYFGASASYNVSHRINSTVVENVCANIGVLCSFVGAVIGALGLIWGF